MGTFLLHQEHPPHPLGPEQRFSQITSCMWHHPSLWPTTRACSASLALPLLILIYSPSMIPQGWRHLLQPLAGTTFLLMLFSRALRGNFADFSQSTLLERKSQKALFTTSQKSVSGCSMPCTSPSEWNPQPKWCWMLWSAVWIWDCCFLSLSHTRNNSVVSVCHGAGLEILEAFLDVSVGIPFPHMLTGSSWSSWLWSKNSGCLVKRFNAWRVTFFKKFCVFPSWAVAISPGYPTRDNNWQDSFVCGGSAPIESPWGRWEGSSWVTGFSWSVKKSQLCPCGLLEALLIFIHTHLYKHLSLHGIFPWEMLV